ncbi:MAG: hypothetical protein ACJA1C_002222 [Crocinitomicaceae bacterium]|jgi:hypothetical protein
MAEEFNFFENSPLNNFSSTSPGSNSVFPSGFKLPDIEGYFWNLAHKEKLVDDLVEARIDMLDYFNFDFKRYQRTSLELVEVFKETFTLAAGKSTPVKSYLNYISVNTSTKKGKVNLVPAIQIIPDPKSLKAKYLVYFYYTENNLPEEYDEVVKILFGEGIGLTPKIKAIEFEMDSFWVFDAFMDKFPFEYRQNMFEGFDWGFGQVSSKIQKRNMFWQAPRSYLIKNSIEKLFEDFLVFLEVDKYGGNEANNTMIKCLEVIASKPGGMEFLYHRFNKNPRLTKNVYENLNGQQKRNGETKANKTIFASLMLMLCHYDDQGFTKERMKRWIKFQIDSNHKIDSNVAFDDTYDNAFDLRQQVKEKMEMSLGYQAKDVSEIWVDDPNKSQHYLHPLDIVTFITYDKKNKKYISVAVPAIFIKDIAQMQEWEEIYSAIRIGIDLLIIAISIGTLTGASVSSLIMRMAWLDLGIASIDIGVKGLEDYLEKSAAGRKFLEIWSAVYGVTGVVTGAAILPSLIEAGAKLLLKVSTEGIEPLKGMLKISLNDTENFIEFVNGKFKILASKAEWVTFNIIYKMYSLAEEGVLLLKGTKAGEATDTFFLNYKGVTLVEGTSKSISTKITQILRSSKSFPSLKLYLDDFARKMSEFGGHVLTKTELNTWRIFLKSEYGAKMEKVKKFDQPEILAQFSPSTNTIKYMENATLYLIVHESFHALEMHLIKFEEYVKDAPFIGTKFPEGYTDENMLRSYWRERFVHDLIIENAVKYGFNNREMWHNMLNLDYYEIQLEKRGITIPN